MYAATATKKNPSTNIVTEVTTVVVTLPVIMK